MPSTIALDVKIVPALGHKYILLMCKIIFANTALYIWIKWMNFRFKCAIKTWEGWMRAKSLIILLCMDLLEPLHPLRLFPILSLPLYPFCLLYLGHLLLSKIAPLGQNPTKIWVFVCPRGEFVASSVHEVVFKKIDSNSFLKKSCTKLKFLLRTKIQFFSSDTLVFWIFSSDTKIQKISKSNASEEKKTVNLRFESSQRTTWL